jgi:pilus assembly protein FimV
MGKRLAPIIAFMAMLTPMAGYALGLGNITMKSALNQPLNAEIELLSVEKGDLSNLLVRLGSDEDFARVGADRAFFLTKIKFTVEKRPDGTPYVKLSTTNAITEPYLDFVVEARWPRGRILREFTVLVDPPSMTQEAPTPVQQAVTQAAPAPAPAATPAPAPEPETRQAAPIPSRATLKPVMRRDGVLSYGPVKRNDTLWEIANQMRPDGVSVNQMMLALVKANPGAFYNGNVNQLKAGYVLRIDDPASIGSVSVAQADAEVERQRMEWQARKSGKLVKQTAVAESSMDGAPAAGTAGGGEQARLKLVAPGSEGAGSGAGDAEMDQLRQDLLIAAEALDANRQETDELKSRLAEMEEQLASMQRLIMLKDDEMLALQKQLGKVPEDATEPAPMEETAPAAEAESMAESDMADAEMAEEAAPVEKVKPKAKKPKVEVPEVEEPGLLENPLILYGAGGAVILGLIAWLVMRRRKMQEGFQESILNVSGEGAEAGMEGAAAAGGESSMVSDFAMSEMSDMDGIQADSTEVDPISEADVYLAYGRHQQAEDILKDAMEKTPERHELKLKLLEVYFAAKNAEAFTQQAEELHAALGDESDPLWAKAVTMGAQLCPTNELFGGSADAEVDPLQEQLAGDVSEADEDLLDFDFDMDSAGLDEDMDTTTAAADDADLDFDLDFDKLDATGTETTEPATTAEEGGEDAATGLDFDVSSLDFDLEQGAESKEADIGLDTASAESEQELSDENLDFDLGDITESGEEGEAVAGEEFSLDDDLASADDLSLGDMSESVSDTTEKADDNLDIASGLDADQVLEGGSDSGLEGGLADIDLNETSEGLEDLNLEGMDTEGTETASDELGDELGGDIFAEVDEVGTKLDLAKAYVDMGDGDGARSILDEVLEEGNDDQKQQAQELLAQIG